MLQMASTTVKASLGGMRLVGWLQGSYMASFNHLEPQWRWLEGWAQLGFSHTKTPASGSQGGSGHLEKVFLERGSRSCQSLMPELAHCHFCYILLAKQSQSPDLRSIDLDFTSQCVECPKNLQTSLIYAKYYELGTLTLILILQTKKTNLRKDK